MSTEQTLYVVKILLKHISEHPEDARTVASGALSMLDGALKVEAEHDTKKDKPNTGAPTKTKRSTDKTGGVKKQTKVKESAPEPKREPFDTGKMRALYNRGWSAAMVADEMGVSVATIYSRANKEGLKFGKTKTNTPAARRLGHPEDCRRDAGHRGDYSETLQGGGSAEG